MQQHKTTSVVMLVFISPLKMKMGFFNRVLLKCRTCEILLLLLWFRELKHRSVKDPSETFKLQEYVNKEMKTSGCCRA